MDSGVIRIGTTATQAPFSIKAKNGMIIGYEIDLAKRLSSSLKVRAQFIEMNFSELLVMLESGEIDMVMSGMAITPERNSRFGFAGPYLVSGKSILTKNKRIIDTPMADLDRPKLSIATLKESTSQMYVKDNLSNCELILVDSYEEAVQLVLSDQVDFMLSDYSECAFAAFRNPGKGLLVKEDLFSIERIGAAIPGDDMLFLNLLDNFLEDLEASGELQRIEDKWFKDGAWLSELED